MFKTTIAMMTPSLEAIETLDNLIDRQPLMLPSQTSLLEAIQAMQRLQTSCVLIPGPSDRAGGVTIGGIFTERNAVQASAQGLDLTQTQLVDVMTSRVITHHSAHVDDIFTILQIFKQHHIRHLPVFHPEGYFLGLISHDSIRHALRPSDLLRRRRVEEVMVANVIQSDPSVPVSDVILLMARHRLSCIVLTEGTQSRPVGILTERDVVNFQSQQLDLSHTIARDVMSHPLQTLQLTDSLWNAKEKMEALQVRRLVVIHPEGQLAGMITQSSILNILDPIELAENLETLQHLVAVRTASLTQEIKHHQATAQQLEKALTDLQVASASNSAKNEFLAHMSHELRTPLTAILGFTELLSTDLTLTEDNRNSLTIINRNSKHLLSLMNNLLELSKIESGYLQVHSHTCDLWNLLRDMEGLFQLRSHAKQLMFTLIRSPQFPRHIITDEKKLRQILINLLSNAIQFTQSGEVQLIADLQKDDLSFQIVDTGPGIAEGDRADLFKPFSIASSPQQIYSGTGIGLAISSHFAEILGGQLRLLSSSLDGSTFELRLPKSTILNQAVAGEQRFNVRTWLINLQQSATHLNSHACRQFFLEPPRSLDITFLEALSDGIERFDFDRVVMLIEEKLSSL